MVETQTKLWRLRGWRSWRREYPDGKEEEKRIEGQGQKTSGDTLLAKTAIEGKEGMVMPDFRVYEDIPDYEKEMEDVAPEASPTTKKQVAKCHATSPVANNPPVIKTQPTTRQ